MRFFLLVLFIISTHTLFAQQKDVNKDLKEYGIYILKVGKTITYTNDSSADVYIITQEKQKKLISSRETLLVENEVLTSKIKLRDDRIEFVEKNNKELLDMSNAKYEAEKMLREKSEQRYDTAMKFDVIKNNVISVSITFGIIGIGAAITTGVISYYLIR